MIERRNRDTDVLRGSIPQRSGRRPRSNDARRVCRAAECGTVLSRYNLRQYCGVHAPLRYPRVRGVVTDRL